MISELTQLAIKASIEAGKDILAIYKSDDFEIESKEDNSPLTKADPRRRSYSIVFPLWGKRLSRGG